jgi:tetratricopeptide (TPR) repeat protein
VGARGAAYRDLKRWDKAVADFSKAIELGRKRALVWINRGRAYRGLERWQEALADFSKAIEMDPLNPRAYAGRAGVHAGLKQWELALADCVKAVELEPNAASAWISRGEVYEKLGQNDKALADYNQAIAVCTEAIALNPKDADGYYSLAWFLVNHPNPKLGVPGRAVEAAKKAVELVPKEGLYWNILGMAHYRAGDWQAALAALKKSMELRTGGDGFDWFFLGMVHWQLGDKEEALTWYRKAVQWMEKNKRTDGELRRFCAESAALLGISAPEAP